MELPEGSRLNDLFRLLKVPLRHGAVLFCMVNYDKAKLSQPLSEGDTVSFLNLVSGG